MIKTFVMYEVHNEKSVRTNLVPRNVSILAAMIGIKCIPEHFTVEYL